MPGRTVVVLANGTRDFGGGMVFEDEELSLETLRAGSMTDIELEAKDLSETDGLHERS